MTEMFGYGRAELAKGVQSFPQLIAALLKGRAILAGHPYRKMYLGLLRRSM